MQTGMRAGELSALHWTDVHDGYIHIDFSEHRKFPLNPAIEDIFRRVRELGREGEFVFTNEKGERQSGWLNFLRSL